MTVKFTAICSLLQSIENISIQQQSLPTPQRQGNTNQIISKWFSDQRNALEDSETKGGAVLSTLIPHRRKDRVFGLKAPSLAKKISSFLAFNHDHKALFEGWKTGTLGDLGAYTERAMKPWDGTFSSKHDFTVNEIDELLTQIASRYRFSDEAVRKQRNRILDADIALKKVLVRLESWEAKWLVRLILRDHATIELDERHVLKSYHFLLPDLLMFQNDFNVVFDLLREELKGFPPTPNGSEEKQLRIQAAKKLKPSVGVKVGRPMFYKAWSLKHCFQMVDGRVWAADVKYDGEYCEIHVDLSNTSRQLQIFSKNGKDATADRKPLHENIRTALRIGEDNCYFASKCIVLGEMVLYSDKEQRILPFHKIRKHVSRSGSFLGTWKDSLPHAWEHLMIVFFDVLLVDDEPVLRHSLQDRRKILRDLITVVPGRSMRSEWTLLDFRTGDGITDFKQAFARTLAHRQEGLIMKPLYAPYFPLLTDQGHNGAGYFIKVKKDYLGDMGGERDLGDFAVIGASLDAQVACKSDMKPLHWTHFYLGCCINKEAVHRVGVRPKFKVVATLSIDGCILKADAKYLNVQGYVRQEALQRNRATSAFDFEHTNDIGTRMAVGFKNPFVAEILGGGYEKVPNEEFEMLRHPRVRKLHSDRTWEDCVTLEDLGRMAEEKWEAPNPDNLDGHAKDVALLVKKCIRAMESQTSSSAYETTQETTQRSEEITPLRPPPVRQKAVGSDATIDETQQSSTTTSSFISDSVTPMPQHSRSRKLLKSPVLVREDTCERLTTTKTSSASIAESQSTLSSTSSSQPLRTLSQPAPLPQKRTSKPPLLQSSSAPLKRLPSFTADISPPAPKRKRTLRSLKNTSGSQKVVGLFDFDSQDEIIHVFVKKGVTVQVHMGVEAEEEEEEEEEEEDEAEEEIEEEL